MKPFVTLLAAFCLLVTARAQGQAVHSQAIHQASPTLATGSDGADIPLDSALADTSTIDHADCPKPEESGPGHDHHQQSGHFMVMLGVGSADAQSVFRTAGAGYEHRFQGWGGLLGVGISGMAMVFRDYTHFMVVGTGTVYPFGDMFFQVETGLTHAHNTGGAANAHQMALLGGLGVGHHCDVSGVAIAPMITVEYSRVQKPTYAFMVCLGL